MEQELLVGNPLNAVIEESLVKHNVTDSVIANLKEKYKDLKLRNLEDKEKYLEIKEAVKDVAKVRILTVKICKAGREDAVKIQKLWVAKEKEVCAKIDEVESPLDAEIKAFDDEVNRKKEEEKRRQEEAYMSRMQALTKMGALYHDNCFALGDTYIESNLVKESSEEVWIEEIFPKFVEEYHKAEAERVEQDRIKAEKEAEMKRQQEELLRQQREFQEQQAEFRKQKEAEERQKAEEQNRIQQERYAKIVQYANVGENIPLSTLWVLSQSDFDEKLAKKKTAFEVWETERQKQIEEAAAKREREKIEEELRFAELKRQQEEQYKAEQLAKAGDKALLDHFLGEVAKIHVPAFKSGQYRKVALTAKTKLDEILSLKAY